MVIEKKLSEIDLLNDVSANTNMVCEQDGEWKRLNLKAGGDKLGLVKNGGNVVINADGTMTTPGTDLPLQSGEGNNSVILNSNRAIGNNSIALGYNNIAGCKGYYIKSIDTTNNNKKIYLCNEKVLPVISTDDNTDTSFSTPAYAVGDSFNIINGSHYVLCGTITSITNNAISYDGDLGFTEIVEDTDPEGHTLFVPKKPTIGIVVITNNSYAVGENTISAGRSGCAEGRDTLVAGNYGHAEGRNSIAAYAAHAEGLRTKAIGESAHAEGRETIASGYTSHAAGRETEASGMYSYTEGYKTKSTRYCGHAEGGETTSTSDYAHAEGYKTKAGGYVSHAEGYDTKAIGESAHAEGRETIASGYISHAGGRETEASGMYSYTEGYKTKSTRYCAHAEGGETTSTNDYAHAEGLRTKASGVSSHAEGCDTKASGDYSHSEGYKSEATDFYSHAEGFQSKAIGECCHAEGYMSEANGLYSHAEGFQSKAIGKCCHAEGYECSASGNYTHAEGCGCTATMVISHAEGSNTTADSGGHAEGSNTFASSGGHAEGVENRTSGSYQHVQGMYSIPNGKYAHIVGGGSKDNVSAEVTRRNIHTVSWEGQGYFAQGTTTTGADYAEFFEWEDGNLNSEDRVGLLVTLDGEKIKLANVNDEIFGIISGTAAVLGDNYECEWNGKYLTDDFGRIIYDEVEEFMDLPVSVDAETNEPIIERKSMGMFKRPRLNPNYDPKQIYVNRSDRPEWDTVGMLGKLYVRDDGTCKVNGYATVGENGVATYSKEKTNMRVLSRVTDNIIKVLLK